MYCCIVTNMCIFTTLCTSFINNQQGALDGVSTGSEFCQVLNINPLKLNYGMHFQDVWFLIRLLTSQINKTSIYLKKSVRGYKFIIHLNVSSSDWVKSPLSPALHNQHYCDQIYKTFVISDKMMSKMQNVARKKARWHRSPKDRVVFCSVLLKVLGKRRENSKWFAKKKELNSVLPKDIARKVRNRTWWITTAICRIPAKLNTSSYPEIDLFMVFFNFWQGQVRENPSTLLKRAS